MTRSRAAAVLLALTLAALPAMAHHLGIVQEPPPDGIPIANLTHGQMTVIAENRTAILGIAARQQPTDRVMRRLEGFVAIQFSACGWGLVPFSIGNENSPFNKCTHAYLAGTQALLLHLQGMPGDRTAVRALVEKIQHEMMESGTALQLCRYSEEWFNTAEIVYPDWQQIAGSIMAPLVGTGMVLVCGMTWLGVRRSHRHAD